MDHASRDFAQASEVARRFLSRWSDGFTRSLKDDLVQEAASEAWRCRSSLRDPERFSSFVRTISRRLRYKALGGGRRMMFSSLQDHLEEVEARPADSEVERTLEVSGKNCDLSWLLGELEPVMQSLTSLNEQLTRSYYEGFSCAELAERFGLEEECVKVRLYRCRRKLRKEFEGRVRRATLGT